MNLNIILHFLSDLAANNNTPWFHANRPSYEAARQNLHELVSQLIPQLSSLEPGLANLQPKECIFRINRDVRFSANKSPYKENMGAYFAVGGKKSWGAGFYLHLQPNEQSFLAGGLYMPDAKRLAAVRQEIDYLTTQFADIVQAPSFVQYFGQLGGSRLQSAPKGYAKDHPAIEWLKHKDFVVTHPMSDQQVNAANFVDYCTQVFAAIQPLNQFLSQAVADPD